MIAKLPIKSGIQLVGGPHGASDILVRPPWQGEQIEAVLLFVTAYGNTAANLLYASPDTFQQILSGAALLQNPEQGVIVAINGAGTIGLQHSPVPVEEFLRVTAAPAANGQIYLAFYWQTWSIPGARVPVAPPEQSSHAQAVERMNEENDVWRKVRGLAPKDFLQQNPGRLTLPQRQRLRQFEQTTDMRQKPGEKIPPG